MSFLNTTARLCHSSKLPDGVTKEQGIKMLQDHEFLVKCDPHMIKFELIDEKDAADAADVALPAACAVPDRVEVIGETQQYRVTDLVHTLPSGLWDSNVVSMCEFIDIQTGVYVRMRSPLSVTMGTVWEIRECADADAGVEGEGEGEGAGGLELFEDINIECSRLLVGVVKSQCEAGWQSIHTKMIDRLQKEVQKS